MLGSSDRRLCRLEEGGRLTISGESLVHDRGYDFGKGFHDDEMVRRSLKGRGFRASGMSLKSRSVSADRSEATTVRFCYAS
jgi:hypothetical protein